jgi:hypothetical protein
MFWKNLLGSIGHQGLSLLAPIIVPLVGSGVAPTPTGGTLDWMVAHPWAFPVYLGLYGVVRDKLKNVPIFAAASGTVAPSQAAAAQMAGKV